MAKPARIIGPLAVVAFVGVIVWNTMSSQKSECEVCVVFNGRRNCAVASAESEKDAETRAQQTACGPVSSGMNEIIACTNRPPVVRQCRTR